MLTDEDKQYVVERLTSYVAMLEKPRQALTSPFVGTTFANDLDTGTPLQMVMDCVRL